VVEEGGVGMYVAATGHRPQKLTEHCRWTPYSEQTREALVGLARQWLQHNKPEVVISGMALGWDQAVARAAVIERIPFVAALPFKGQHMRWPIREQAQYEELLQASSEIHFICELEVLSDSAVAVAMQKRNEWMVDHCDHVLALWSGSFGGTANCIRYAGKKHIEVINLWSSWRALTELDQIMS
jgi:uncharacterized phage-like protein YoqJ